MTLRESRKRPRTVSGSTSPDIAAEQALFAST